MADELDFTVHGSSEQEIRTKATEIAEAFFGCPVSLRIYTTALMAISDVPITFSAQVTAKPEGF